MIAFVEVQPICQQLALARHAQAGETQPSQILDRVARALGRRPEESRRFRAALDAGLLPGGRILANAGRSDSAQAGRAQPTLANCFVQPLGPGATGLRQARRQIGQTLASGGGVGLDLSACEPQHDADHGRLVRTLRVLERLAHQLERHGGRPAALMGVLAVSHPSVHSLIHVKQGQTLPHFNLSIALTDEFMRSLRTDPQAQALWKEISQAALEVGDPGVLFIDTIQRADNLGLQERITACNPCGEQPLPDWGACVLASIDLTRVIRAPFTPHASVDTDRLAWLARTGAALLDEAIDRCQFPWPEQAALAQAQRRVGLGLLGLGDALVMLGIRYDSAHGRATSVSIMRTIQCAAWQASIARARRLGPCPSIDPLRLLAHGHSASRLPRSLQCALRRHGVRNSHLTCIAPTGTLSLAWADNASPGIEPIFAQEGERFSSTGQGRMTALGVSSPALRLWRRMNTGGWPPAWITRDQVRPAAQVAMVGALQPWVDGGISKTLALPSSCNAESVADGFRLAWRCGLKGLTVYREPTGCCG